MAVKGWIPKNIITIYGCLGIAVVVELALVALMVYLLRSLANDLWEFFTEPGLSQRLTDIAMSLGSLGLCCAGILLLAIIVAKIPPKWWHGGLEASSDDDDDPYYRYM